MSKKSHLIGKQFPPFHKPKENFVLLGDGHFRNESPMTIVVLRKRNRGKIPDCSLMSTGACAQIPPAKTVRDSKKGRQRDS